MYAVYIHTITLTMALQGRTSYTEMSNSHHEPNVSHLWIFGLLGWAHVLKEVCPYKA